MYCLVAFFAVSKTVDGGSNVVHDSELASFTLRILPNVLSSLMVKHLAVYCCMGFVNLLLPHPYSRVSVFISIPDEGSCRGAETLNKKVFWVEDNVHESRTMVKHSN